MSELDQFLLYTAPDGTVKLHVLLHDEKVWLSQKGLAELFGVQIPATNKHLRRIFESGELVEDSVVSKMEITAADGKTYRTKYYNLDAIIAVGCRVRGPRGAQFRRWASARLTEYLVKGFALDDERLANPPGPGVPDRFDHLLELIDDIRANGERLYTRAKDLLSLTADFGPKDEGADSVLSAFKRRLWIDPYDIAAMNRRARGLLAFAEAHTRARRPIFVRDLMELCSDAAPGAPVVHTGVAP
jgi:hypothetical protein